MSDLQENSTDDQEVSMIIKLMTLNCWGLYGVSKFRTQRMEAIALCKKIVQIFQKIMSKSCFNFTFSTILACQALLVDNKSTVQI